MADSMVSSSPRSIENSLDCDSLVGYEGFERRELEEIAVLDIRDGSSEDTVTREFVEHLAERLLVERSIVIVAFGYAVIVIQDLIRAIASKKPNQLRLKI